MPHHTTEETEAAVQRCFVQKMFLKISQISLENTFAIVSFLITACTFIKKETVGIGVLL